MRPAEAPQAAWMPALAGMTVRGSVVTGMTGLGAHRMAYLLSCGSILTAVA